VLALPQKRTGRADILRPTGFVFFLPRLKIALTNGAPSMPVRDNG
jgi:hypothetical protein